MIIVVLFIYIDQNFIFKWNDFHTEVQYVSL